MSDESSGGLASGNVPEAELGIPARRERKGAVRGNDNVRDEMGMASKSTTSVAIRVIFSSGGMSELPDQDGLVARRRQQEVWVFRRCGEAGDPVTVALQRSTQNQVLSRHVTFVDARDSSFG